MNNLDILREVTQRLDNKTLESLSHTPIWNSIKSFSQDQLWWYHRTEYLVRRSLSPRRGDWARVYKSLSENELSFSSTQDYESPLLVSILLELGEDPSIEYNYILRQVSRRGYTETVRLLLTDARVNPKCNTPGEDDYLLDVIDEGHLEVAYLLLSDKRIGYTGYLLPSAIKSGDLRIVKIILARDVDPSSREVIKLAMEHGSAEMISLLLLDSRIDPSMCGDYLLQRATKKGYIEIVRFILEDKREVDSHTRQFGMNSSLDEACKTGSLEMVELLLSHHHDPIVANNHFLRTAREYKRLDVEKLLLADERIKKEDLR